MSLLPIASNLGAYPMWWQGAAILFQAHRIWKWITWQQTYGNPNNWLGLTMGHWMDSKISDNFITRMPFVALLISKRFLDVLEQKDTTEKAFNHWKDACRGIHPIYSEEKSTPLGHVRWVSSLDLLSIRVQRIAHCTLILGKEVLKLVMRILDLLEFATFDRHQYEELLRISVQQGPLNLVQCMEALERNETSFLQRLEQEGPAIEKCMQFLHLPGHSHDVIKNVKTFFDWSKTAQKTYKKASSIFGDATSDLFKFAIQGMVSDELKPTINKMLNFDPNNNFWKSTSKKDYAFPHVIEVVKLHQVQSLPMASCSVVVVDEKPKPPPRCYDEYSVLSSPLKLPATKSEYAIPILDDCPLESIPV